MRFSRIALLIVAGLLVVGCQRPALEQEVNSPPTEETTPSDAARDNVQASTTQPPQLHSPDKREGKQCQIPAIKNAADVARFKQQCKARTECQLIKEESCYCPPGVQCVCGGGKGPRCVSKTQPLPSDDQTQ